MFKLKSRSHQADSFFVMLLFFLFALTAIFVIGCAIMEITTWFIDSYVMFYIGIIIVIVGIIGMIIQGKFKKVIEFIIEYF